MPRSLEMFAQDVRYALRSFRRSPGFVAVALVSLTLGIGATSAIFSVIYGVLIAPYPYARPGEIWAPQVRSVDGRGGWSGHTLEDFLEMARLPAFGDVMATSGETVVLTGEFSSESFQGVLLSGNAFNFLGVTPVAGRTIQPADIRGDGEPEPVVVLSHRLWQRLFDGDPAAIGRALRLNGRPHTIIGVMPPRFGWYGNDGMWLPLGTSRRAGQFVAPIVRLAPGVSSASAEQQLHAFYQQRARENPGAYPAQGFTTVLNNYLDVTVASGDMQASLRVLLGAVGVLLLIACANVSNLQLARATARSREIAIRSAVGAGRQRLLRQLLTESVLLSIAGGAAGVLFAFVATKAIVALMPEFYVPNEARVTMNLPVLLFSLAVAVLSGVLFGIAPALQSSKPDVVDALKGGRGAGEGASGGRARNMLVVSEVALSVVLLVGAGLMVRTFLVLQSTDSGLRTDNVLIAGVPLSETKYPTLERRNLFAGELLERVSGMPGVTAASIGNGGMPFGGPMSPLAIAGDASGESRRVMLHLVGADYLRVLGIQLRAGRPFDGAEVRRGDRVVLINEAAAKLWPAGQDPIGSRITLGLLEQAPRGVLVDKERGADATVIGVVADVRNAGYRQPAAALVLLPYALIAPLQRTLAVRTAGDPSLVLGAIRELVRSMDPEQPLGRVTTLQDAFDQQVVQPRFTMALFAVFAGLGLALAAAGIYGVLSFTVARRSRELGVRLALGAPRAAVLGLMLGMGARLAGAGLVVGVLASLAATPLLQSQLFGVTAHDPLAYAVVAIVLGGVALLACYLPARRAAAVDPLVALRE